MRTVLITGAAKRIGAFIAQHLHQLGFNIIIHYHQSEKEAQTLCKHLLQNRPYSAHLIQADLNDPNCIQSIMTMMAAYTARLDAIIHNASIFSAADQDWDALFQIHVKTPYQLNLAAYSLLKQHQGSIINITDIYATKPQRHYSAYLQSKAALHMQTLSLALEFAPEVRVNEIAPGKILAPTIQIQTEQDILQSIPLKRRGTPLDIAKAAAFLLDSAYITGQTIYVDGGAYLNAP